MYEDVAKITSILLLDKAGVTKSGFKDSVLLVTYTENQEILKGLIKEIDMDQVNPIDYWYQKYLKEKEKKAIVPPVPEQLKLTWEDVDLIICTWIDVMNEMDGTKEELYTEVVQRFNKIKNGGADNTSE